MARYLLGRYWNVWRGREVARISVPDGHGREFWAEIETGKGWNQRRDDAIDAIVAAMQRNDPPGEVKLR